MLAATLNTHTKPLALNLVFDSRQSLLKNIMHVRKRRILNLQHTMNPWNISQCRTKLGAL